MFSSYPAVYKLSLNVNRQAQENKTRKEVGEESALPVISAEVYLL